MSKNSLKNRFFSKWLKIKQNISGWGELFSKWEKLVSRSTRSQSWLCPFKTISIYFRNLTWLFKKRLVTILKIMQRQESCRITCLFYPSFLIIYHELPDINTIVFYENISFKLISGFTCVSQLVTMVSAVKNLF